MDGLTQLNSTQFPTLTEPNENLQGDLIDWMFALSFVARLVVYVLILALLVVIFSLILKYFGECDCERTPTPEEGAENETNPLWPEKAKPFTYGTCDEDDLESGECTASSSQVLYDEKICVICYEYQRNCFFVPCGHCATCYACAQRILEGESKTCPVCRRLIRKVRKIFPL